MEKSTHIAEEKAVVKQMIGIYCQGQHQSPKGTLCADCDALWHYAQERLDHCPFGEEKDFCSFCPHHCYAPNMQAKIRQVMRYSGWRMLFHRPVWTLRHLQKGQKLKKAQQKSSR